MGLKHMPTPNRELPPIPEQLNGGSMTVPLMSLRTAAFAMYKRGGDILGFGVGVGVVCPFENQSQ